MHPKKSSPWAWELLAAQTVLAPMRDERRRGAEQVEQRLLPIINIVFLLIPVVLAVIELTSFAALQASTADAPHAAQAPATPRLSVTDEGRDDDDPTVTEPPRRRALFPDPVVGYGP